MCDCDYTIWLSGHVLLQAETVRKLIEKQTTKKKEDDKVKYLLRNINSL